MTRDVSVIGPLNVDLLIVGEGPPSWESIPTWDGPSEMEMTAAGSVGYAVSDMARLGMDVAVTSCVPDDPLGAFIIDALSRDGVDISGVQMVPETQAGIAVYLLLFGSRKRPLTYRLPTHEPWPQRLDEEKMARLLDARLLHSGGYLHFKSAWHGITTELFKAAKGRGLITSLDPQFPLFAMDPPWMDSIEDLLSCIEILFCDESEARKLTALSDLDASAHRLMDAGPSVVVIKQGGEGSTIYRGDWQYHQPAVAMGEVVDSIGAGDAYDAAFLLGTLEGWPLEKRALFASIAAGYTVTGVGGTHTFPERAQIETSMIEMER